ncbi:MAG: hypothetical protein OJF58_001007 [Enhydrobacter sp.]|nr:MAG: hypothetical protein OJF58_001007 [Enhydrobacter sp.]
MQASGCLVWQGTTLGKSSGAILNELLCNEVLYHANRAPSELTLNSERAHHRPASEKDSRLGVLVFLRGQCSKLCLDFGLPVLKAHPNDCVFVCEPAQHSLHGG